VWVGLASRSQGASTGRGGSGPLERLQPDGVAGAGPRRGQAPAAATTRLGGAVASAKSTRARRSERAGERESGRICLHYLLNKLQPLPWEQPVVVSLNPVREIQRSQVMAEYDYDHPVLDLAAIRAQAEVPALQGQRNTWFAGAWMGYGFHEDGLKAGLAVVEGLRARLSAGENPTTARLAA